MKWTKSQQQAIETRDKSLLVSAAAGSGKTAVLVERIIQLIIQDKVQVDELLVVTFTRAAAEEMRMQIYNSLRKIKPKDKHEREFINKQLTNLSSASISTLHSFCLEITKSYFQVINIDPSLKIGDDNQIMMLKNKAMDQLLDEEYERGEENFIKLLEMFNNARDDKSIRDIIDDLHVFLLNRSNPKEWAKNAIENFSLNLSEFNKSVYYDELRNNTEKKLISAKVYLTNAIDIAEYLEDDKAKSILSEEQLQIESLLNGLETSYEAFYSSLEKTSFKTLRLKGDDEDSKEQIKYLRNMAKEIVNSIKENLQYNPPQQMLEDLREMKSVIETLVKLVFKYNEIFKANKLEKGIIDFNDVEHYTLEILKEPAVVEELRERYRYIFVDEYQDSNEIQDYIVDKIKREDNLFFVGDVKQSIYRFRMADPTLFYKERRRI